jgi:HD domain
MPHPHPIIEDVFNTFGVMMGEDFHRYRNHVYRVFLYCTLLDDDADLIDKYAIAAVFHDIGIWTNKTFDYLDPSVEQAARFLAKIEKEEWTDEITSMIYWHHKMTPYHGKHEKLVEVFRQADWIDVSRGILSFGVGRDHIRKVSKLFPTLGFHRFLLKETLKNFFRHPLNPLPMVRG